MYVSGSTVSATVSHIVDDIIFVIFNSKITGSLRKENYKEGVKVGDKINCLVLSYTYPSLDAELVQLESPLKGKKVRLLFFGLFTFHSERASLASGADEKGLLCRTL